MRNATALRNQIETGIRDYEIENGFQNANVNVEARWTGAYPNLCSGTWEITVNGEDYSYAIPDDKRRDSMDTFGEYSYWRFDDNWEVQWKFYESGKEFAEWILENQWVNQIPAPPEKIYAAIQGQDWRHAQCGGCI